MDRRWKKRTSPSPSRSSLLFPTISLISLLLFLFSYNNSHFSNPTLAISQNPQRVPFHCIKLNSGEKFLWYAPHSGFSNQLSEFKNALSVAAILNRTLVVPPVLDHHAVVLGSCPKFRVSSPEDIRFALWDHAIDLIRTRRYVSMADIVDLSNLVSSSDVRVIDFRVFVSIYCDLMIDTLCSEDLSSLSLSNTLRQCGAMLSGYNGSFGNCLYPVNEDCRTTVWTYGNDGEDGTFDSFQPDEQLKKKKKITYVRKRFDVYKALGPGSIAGSASILAFGSLFTAPYKGSESYIDIRKDPRDERIKSVIEKVQFLPFVPEIASAGKEFASKTIKSPFLCAQLRLLDGQFKNHHKATFMGLKQKIDTLLEKGPLPIHIFVMTDLPQSNWTGTYLQDVANDSTNFKLHVLRDKDELVARTANKLIEARNGLKLSLVPENYDRAKMVCHVTPSPDLLLYIEESICSCATLGFVGTTGSTIAESIDLMRKNSVCSGQSANLL